METILANRPREIEKNKQEIERRLGVKIDIKGRRVTIDGPSLNEYEANMVIEAINFGFSSHIALTLKDEEMMFERLSIKDFTRRKNLADVKARIIGTQGRTKRTIENIANCHLVIQGNEVGIIGSADELEYAITALKNLIRGSKQSNVYNFLERINTRKKEERRESSNV